MRDEPLLLAFNRGLMAKQALARIDLKRTALSAEIMKNWMPRVLGSMSLRAGLGYLGSTAANAKAAAVPFVFSSTSDTALVELTDQTMRVWVDDAVITRPAVSSVVTNGNFLGGLTGWTDSSEVGCVLDWVAGNDTLIFSPPNFATQILRFDPTNETSRGFGSFIYLTQRYGASVRAANGYIYCAPISTGNVLKINPVMETSVTIGPVVNGYAGYGGAIAAPNGKLYFTPGEDNDVLVIDPATDAISYIEVAGASGSAPWTPGVLVGNYIYCAPFGDYSNQVLKIDTTTDTATTFGTFAADTYRYGSGANVNGVIYYPPMDAGNVLKVNTATDTTTTFSGTGLGGYNGAGMWGWSVYTGGYVYCIPNNSAQVLRINPVNDSYTFIDIPGRVFGDNAFGQPVVASNGIIYAFNSGLMLRIDPSSGTATQVAHATSAGGVGAAAATGGSVGFIGTGMDEAIIDQEITVAAGDQNIEHGLHIHIARGLFYLSVGSALGGTQYIDRMALNAGWHSISVVPTGNFFIRLASPTKTPSLLQSVSIDPPGPMEVETTWNEVDLPYVRWEQSGDVLFCCDGAHRQRKLIRQDVRSWSNEEYLTTDGPFRLENSSPITLSASAITGSVNLTSSKSLFKPSHVGALFRLSSSGQTVTATITGEDQWTTEIRVTGITSGRAFYLGITGKVLGDTGTVTLQRSVGAPGDWTTAATYTADTSISYNDGLDNQIVYYRIGVATGGYGTDAFQVTLSYGSGSVEGTCRVTAYTSPTGVVVDVLDDFGGTAATDSWWEGQWSDLRGWPSAVALYDGRLWWAGHDKIDGSVSDAYASFDDTTEGDAGPISRGLGSGPVDNINWMLPLSQLLVGTEGSEQTARASSLDEPLTPSAFSLKAISTQGSAAVGALRVDTSGIFVQRNGYRVMESALGETSYTYSTADLTSIVPDIGKPGVQRMAVQRQPDTRIFCVRADGTVAVLVYDRAENVSCWIEMETDGIVEEVAVLPGAVEDAVYFVVKRTVNGVDVRYLERFALESETRGAAVTKLADSFTFFAGPLTTVTGLDYLEGKTVCVWGNSKDLGTYVVSAGSITLTESATNITVGLVYTAPFKSAKFNLESRYETVTLTHPKTINHVGLVLTDTHAQGLRFGQDFDHLDSLPQIEAGIPVDPNGVWSSYEDDSVEVDGVWDRDARLCLQAASPRACTVIACLVDISGHGK